jgi:YVTN family beta-propeller protein
MRLTIARMPDQLTSFHSPKRHTSHSVAWRQSLAVTAALLLALVVGAAPVLAQGPNLPRQVAQITVGPGPLGIAIVQNRGTFAFVSNINADTVSVINTKSRTVVATTTVGNNPSPVAAPNNGRFVYVGTEASIAVIDTSTFKVVRTIGADGDASFGLAVSPNGRFLYADPGGSGPVKVFDAQSGALVSQFLPNNGHPGALAVSPNGQRLYVGVFDKPFWVDVFDTQSLTQLAAISVPLNPLGITVSPNGRQLYVTNWGDFSNIIPIAGKTVQVFDTASLHLVGTIPVGDFPSDVAFTPNGQLAYVVNNTQPGTVSVVTTRDLTVLTTVAVGVCPTSVAVTPDDGHDAYVTNTGEGATCSANQNTVSVLSR